MPENIASPARNRVFTEDRGFHDWYRFVLSFPPHLVRKYLTEEFQVAPGSAVLDPFCGTGTTVVEAKKLGFVGVGFEAHPMSRFASRTKTDWEGNPRRLRLAAEAAIELAVKRDKECASNKLSFSDDQFDVILENSICAEPLHRLLCLRNAIFEVFDPTHAPYALLALATSAVYDASNLHFGPEVGVRGRNHDAPVFPQWFDRIQSMAHDLEVADAERIDPPSSVYERDARDAGLLLPKGEVSAVFTSPPYPNEKDYTRTTRLETVLLNFLGDKRSLRAMKQKLLRSNTRTVYKGDSDDQYISSFPRVTQLADRIEARRLELGKTSGFEKLYASVTRLYFGGMARHLANLRPSLARNAKLGYVVGDQASFFQVHIGTADILSEIAVSLGYRHVRTDTFRTRIATATKQQMEEHVLYLEWPG